LEEHANNSTTTTCNTHAGQKQVWLRRGAAQRSETDGNIEHVPGLEAHRSVAGVFLYWGVFEMAGGRHTAGILSASIRNTPIFTSHAKAMPYPYSSRTVAVVFFQHLPLL